SVAQRATKWARRHRPVVWAAAILFLVLAIVVGVNRLWWVKQRAGAEGTARATLQVANRLQQEEKWDQALTVVRATETTLASLGASPALCHEVEQLVRDLEMVQRLHDVRLQAMGELDG